MAETGAADEHMLQVHVTLEMEKHLASKGRRLIGWDEIFEDGLSQTAAVMWWHKTKGVAIAEAGNGLVVAHSSSLYFDKYQSKDKANQPLAIGGYVGIEKVYALDPIPEGLSPEAAKNVLGAQAQLWTEYIPTTEQAEYMLFPRLCALAETTWLDQDKKDYANFSTRLEHHVQRLEKQGINYFKAKK
jgi:hexosaminidase